MSGVVARTLSVPGIEVKLLVPNTWRPGTLAVVAHPWARLGGSWNDPVIQQLATTLISRGIPTVLFNSRGAGQTERSPSWMGAGERDDYAEVLEAGMREVLGEATKEGEVFICGYSHGALLALAQKPILRSLNVFKLLVSPPLSVRWFLTPALSTTLSLPPATARPSRREHALVLYGTADIFSPAATTRAWTAKAGSHTRAVELPEGDHFWRAGADPLGRLCSEVESWLADGWESTDGVSADRPAERML